MACLLSFLLVAAEVADVEPGIDGATLTDLQSDLARSALRQGLRAEKAACHVRPLDTVEYAKLPELPCTRKAQKAQQVLPNALPSRLSVGQRGSALLAFVAPCAVQAATVVARSKG